MNIERFAVYMDSHAIRNVGEVPQLSVLHFNHQIVAGDIHNFATLNCYFMGGRRMCDGLLALDLCCRWQREGKTESGSRQ
jgi:hypothetical protein